MNWFLIVLVIVFGGFFVWQLVLLIRDIIKKVKDKKNKKMDSISNENTKEGE